MQAFRVLGVLSFQLALVCVAAAQTDPLVEQMTQAVSKDNLTSYVQTLQDFQTRYTYTQGNTDAGDWLYNFFASRGIEVERHQFPLGSGTEDNIIARIRGRTLPDEIVVISGHFDSTSEQPDVLAPGADDDASGISGVLEAALVFSNYQFDRTVEFMCFNAEEQGRRGSRAIATDYQAAGKNLVAVLNSDMIGYWPTGWGRDLDVAYEPVSEWLADQVISACQRYVGIPIAKHLSGACRDDHISFTNLGYSAVSNMDCWDAHNGGGESTPHYHRSTDTIDTLNLDCMTQVVQVNVAVVAELAGPLSLSASSSTVSALAGGSIDLALTAGPVQGGRDYLVFGSVSGTSPGIPLPGGPVLPINWDIFTQLVIRLANTSNFARFRDTLDADGRATATFIVPAGVLVGYEYILSFYFAYALLQPLDFASTPVQIDVVP
ncbi:MAG: M20/M25/M40 family metallo-hydrolase [Planctomycetota bacterium]